MGLTSSQARHFYDWFVVELAGHQPGRPAGGGQAQHRQVTGQPLAHLRDDSQRRPVLLQNSAQGR
jgi:hypothetical protein